MRVKKYSSPSKNSDWLWINKFPCLKFRFLSPSKLTQLEFLLLFPSTESRAGKLFQKTQWKSFFSQWNRENTGTVEWEWESRGIWQLPARPRRELVWGPIHVRKSKLLNEHSLASLPAGSEWYFPYLTLLLFQMREILIAGNDLWPVLTAGPQLIKAQKDKFFWH